MKRPRYGNGAAVVAGEAPCSVERTHRSVIERKLLTALEDDNTVAILASKHDLETFLAALRSYRGLSGPDEMRAKCKDLGDGIEQLLREAFPPNDPGEPSGVKQSESKD